MSDQSRLAAADYAAITRADQALLLLQAWAIPDAARRPVICRSLLQNNEIQHSDQAKFLEVFHKSAGGAK